jgi:hypothetical protein
MQSTEDDDDAVADMLAVSRQHLRNIGHLKDARRPSVQMRAMKKEESPDVRLPFRNPDILAAPTSLLWKGHTCVGK